MIEEIIKFKRDEVENLKKSKPLSLIQTMAESIERESDIGLSLLSMSNKPNHLLADCIEDNPVTGVHLSNVIQTAKYYELKGFSAIFYMTDEKFFGGSLETLRNLSSQLKIPVIRNDFIVDEYQIFQSKAYGADSYLLRADVLDTALLQYYLEIGRDLKMEAIIAANNIEQLKSAIETDCKIILCNFNILEEEQESTIPDQMFKMIKKEGQGRIVLCKCFIKDIETFAKVGYKTFVVPAEQDIKT